MVTLTLTPTPATASVQVVVTAPATAVLVSLTRTDANGSRPVRLRAGQTIVAGALTVTDFEAALTGTVIYTCTVTVSAARQDGSASTTLGSSTIGPRLAPAVRPDLGVALTMVRTYEATRPGNAVAHEVIGRRDPLVSLGAQGTRRGTLGLYCHTYADAAAIETALGTGEVLLLRQQDFPALDMYFAALNTSTAPFEENTPTRRWGVIVDFLEVAAPAGALYGTVGWTVAANLARNATLALSQAEFATVAALTAGPAAP